jgi:hypothetical protein
MKKIFFISIFVLFASALTAEAAPAPWGLALNHETKECAGYWAGDEFVAYGLPEGWKAYYPAYDSSSSAEQWGKIKTEVGECNFQIQKEEACCAELGYKYVSDNIGKGQMTNLRDPGSLRKPSVKLPIFIFLAVTGFVLVIAVAILIFLFYIWRKKIKFKKGSKLSKE